MPDFLRGLRIGATMFLGYYSHEGIMVSVSAVVPLRRSREASRPRGAVCLDDPRLTPQVLKPRVTVAVPSLNQGRFLDTTLRSIFAQPLDIEVMLADGGSTDDSLAVAERWRDRLAWFRSARDRGQAAAINEAIGRSRAPFVCWLNSDDIYLPDGLAALVQAIEADPSVDVVYGNCVVIDAQGRLIGRCRSRPFSAHWLSRYSIIAQPATVIRREAWERAGGLDERLHFSLDYDLWWRLHRIGARFRRIETDVAAARHHPAAKSFVFARAQYAEAKAVVLRHTGSLPLIWRLHEPLSVGARTGGAALRNLARFWRRWRAGF
jgi:GT2 family glycosyltransferase